MYHLYVLKSEVSGQLYFGYTASLKKRIKQHNNRESLFTKSRVPWKLVYCESYKSKFDALRREKQLKKYAKAYSMLKNRMKESVK